MNRIRLVGLDGSSPLGFLAGLGLLRLVPGARLGFSEDGSFRAFVCGPDTSESGIRDLIAADALASGSSGAAWRFTYTKASTKKQGPQVVADLKPPPVDFRAFLATCVEAWLVGHDEPAGYGAAYGTDVAVDGKGNTKPTALHFTAANQTFLGAVEGIRSSLTREWIETSLFLGYGDRPGGNLRWDPASERNWALMPANPIEEGTCVNAPLEWLAFRGLPLLPCFPRGSKVITSGVSGRGTHMTFTWPLWSVPASLRTVRSALVVDWSGRAKDRVACGIFALCSSAIRRSSQGFGNFGPPSVTC